MCKAVHKTGKRESVLTHHTPKHTVSGEHSLPIILYTCRAQTHNNVYTCLFQSYLGCYPVFSGTHLQWTSKSGITGAGVRFLSDTKGEKVLKKIQGAFCGMEIRCYLQLSVTALSNTFLSGQLTMLCSNVTDEVNTHVAWLM